MKTILVYGDSNSHGTPPLRGLPAEGRHPKPDRWPEVMAAALGAGFDVITDGLPGRTTVHEDHVEGGARNGAAVLPSSLHAHKPLDLVIIMLGTNDLKKRFSVSSWEVARSVARLIGIVNAQGLGCDVMVVSPVPVRETGTLTEVFAGAEARQAGLDAHLEDVARDAGAGFFAAGSVAQVSDVDGVHLAIGAHRALGAAMADVVKARLG